MSEWNLIISVVGTLSGTIIGLVLGYWTSSKIESRRQKHEKEMQNPFFIHYILRVKFYPQTQTSYIKGIGTLLHHFSIKNRIRIS